MNHTISRRAAFTLLEVLLVLAIIVLIAGLVAPSLFGVYEKAKFDKARSEIITMYGQCDLYRLYLHEYPSSLNQLVEGRELATKGLEPLLPRMPKDPWGHEYVYEPQPGGTKPRIYSLGRDGQPGTADDVYEEETQ